MNGGMRIDPKELPLRHQEQVAAAILAQFARMPPVAAKKNKPLKARARRLCFPSAKAIDRYQLLKQAEKDGLIEELLVETYDGRVVAFRYRVIWYGEFAPTGIPFTTLMAWRCQSGTIAVEPIAWKRPEEY